jgi:hypothetical protein
MEFIDYLLSDQRSTGNLKERDHLKDLGVDGRTILKFTFKKWNGGTD